MIKNNENFDLLYTISSSELNTPAKVARVSKGESKSAMSPATSLKKDLHCMASVLILVAADLLSSSEVNVIFLLSRLF